MQERSNAEPISTTLTGSVCIVVSRSEHWHQGDRERGQSKERCHLLSDASRGNSEERRLQASRSSSGERAHPKDKQGNSSDSPVPSTSESSTPTGRRPAAKSSRPHISYSPLHPSVGKDGDEQRSPVAKRRGKAKRGTQERVLDDRRGEEEQDPSPLRRYPSEPFLASQEGEHSPDPSGPMETLTFEAAMACSLGRSNTVSSGRPRLRTGWQVPNGHFRKHLAQTTSAAGCDPLSDTEEDDRC
ncbi:hypothetical protein F7725_011376 [Dissostichus mawsoni]|uniref:Uncharacterized protein n=1 Tax=Dissostichus mawsoni TaxID=36200 RepID=A0A7J5Z8W2_DISMA|nr:hypothetical protein F7725_011376 [Dissostichus mawsoni]